MALGDALGAETEFLNLDGILKRFPPNGPQAPVGNPAKVTDDTEMALAVGEALVSVDGRFTPDALFEAFKKSFISWYHSTDNSRAPGITCITSVENLMEGTAWQDATNISSKGCGANMRVMPVAFLDVDASTRAAIAQFQAALTHAHPTGLAAADLTAFVIHDLYRGGDVESLLTRVRDYAVSQRKVYHEAWLGDLWYRVAVMKDASTYIAHGWDECLASIERIEAAVQHMDRNSDPCLATGEGWIAEEAFATALLCFLMYPDSPVEVIRRAAYTAGDSDSLACIAGSFAGAYQGIDMWPADWIEHIEFRERIATLARDLSKSTV